MGLVIVLNNVIKITNATHQVIEVENGAPVVRGVDGKDGKSAYEVAVENGFIGTEQEWLESLKGEKGETGSTGPTGATFTPSVDADGYISWTNNKGLANPDTVNIKGPQGDTGPTEQRDHLELMVQTERHSLHLWILAETFHGPMIRD